MNGREMSRKTSAKLINAQRSNTTQPNKQIGRKCRQTLAAQAAKDILRNNWQQRQ